jgi:hypothetical protein
MDGKDEILKPKILPESGFLGCATLATGRAVIAELVRTARRVAPTHRA